MGNFHFHVSCTVKITTKTIIHLCYNVILCPVFWDLGGCNVLPSLLDLPLWSVSKQHRGKVTGWIIVLKKRVAENVFYQSSARWMGTIYYLFISKSQIPA